MQGMFRQKDFEDIHESQDGPTHTKPTDIVAGDSRAIIEICACESCKFRHKTRLMVSGCPLD
jgi:hypothetical protein